MRSRRANGKCTSAPRLAAVALVLLTAACMPSPDELLDKSARYATRNNLKEVRIPTGEFTLMAFERITQPTAPVRVFIEGDGKAWLTNIQPSPDPTPYVPTALFIAGVDNSPNVAYLARPCQFLTSASCNTDVWTTHQYSERNIAALNKALDRWQGHKLELVGYSGGAAVALLLAARRTDVINIRTVAGNTDTLAFTQHHHVTPPAPDALNPVAFISRTAKIPQIHFVGADDTTVPEALAQAYQAKLPTPNCSKVISIPNTDHMTGWPEHWARMSARLLPCTQQ